MDAEVLPLILDILWKLNVSAFVFIQEDNVERQLQNANCAFRNLSLKQDLLWGNIFLNLEYRSCIKHWPAHQHFMGEHQIYV